MADLTIAYIKVNADGLDYVDNMALYDDANYEEVKALIIQYNLLPGVTMVRATDLPPGVWIGWIKGADGIWFNPNAPEPEPEQPA